MFELCNHTEVSQYEVARTNCKIEVRVAAIANEVRGKKTDTGGNVKYGKVGNVAPEEQIPDNPFDS